MTWVSVYATQYWEVANLYDNENDKLYSIDLFGTQIIFRKIKLKKQDLVCESRQDLTMIFFSSLRCWMSHTFVATWTWLGFIWTCEQNYKMHATDTNCNWYCWPSHLSCSCSWSYVIQTRTIRNHKEIEFKLIKSLTINKHREGPVNPEINKKLSKLNSCAYQWRPLPLSSSFNNNQYQLGLLQLLNNNKRRCGVTLKNLSYFST